MVFTDRVEAGQILAGRLGSYFRQKDVIVLGIPRGGVPVAFEIAKALQAPLDVFVSRKLAFRANRSWRLAQFRRAVFGFLTLKS